MCAIFHKPPMSRDAEASGAYLRRLSGYDMDVINRVFEESYVCEYPPTLKQMVDSAVRISKNKHNEQTKTMKNIETKQKQCIHSIEAAEVFILAFLEVFGFSSVSSLLIAAYENQFNIVFDKENMSHPREKIEAAKEYITSDMRVTV